MSDPDYIAVVAVAVLLHGQDWPMILCALAVGKALSRQACKS